MLVGVMGLGYVGLPITLAAADAGFEVIGFDVDLQKLESLRTAFNPLTNSLDESLARYLKIARVVFTSNPEELKNVDILVIAVPTPLDLEGRPDLSYLNSAVELIPTDLKSDALVISESTSHPGTLRKVIAEVLQKRSHDSKSWEFAIAPERIDPSNSDWTIKNTPRIIGGLTPSATKRAATFYRTFVSDVQEVASPEIAEAAKLLENSFRLINIAFINEFAQYCYRLGLSANNVIDAASTKPFGFMAFRPGVGVGGHCIPVDPVYLLQSALENDVDLEILKIAIQRKANSKFILEVVRRFFNGELNQKTIQVVGIAYKANVADTRESASIEVLKLLRAEGATVFWHDSLVDSWNGEKSKELITNIDLGLVLVNHDGASLAAWTNVGNKVLDFTNGAGPAFRSIF